MQQRIFQRYPANISVSSSRFERAFSLVAPTIAFAMKRLGISCVTDYWASGFIILALLELTVRCSGKDCHVKIKDGKMIQEGDCVNPDNHPIINELRQKVERKVAASLLPRTCDDVIPEAAIIKNNTGGLFDIRHPSIGKIQVYCDTVTDGGRWTVFQRRTDGSVNFYLGWNEYVNGFGNKTKEFWLGLETIHQMTKTGDHELRIDMVMTDGTRQYAKYRSFSVGPSSGYYRLSVRNYSGNADDHFSYNHNMGFTTNDADHDDAKSINCAVDRSGAWWYKNCTWINPNGLFQGSSEYANRIQWFRSILSFIEMKFRKRQ